MKIYAIIVLYKPDLTLLNNVLRTICPQVSKCVLLNNGEDEISFCDFTNVHYVCLGKNFGIAYAQNRGIEIAKNEGADFVLLSDQDTIYPENFMKEIFEGAKGFDFDALCPVFYDLVKKESSPIMLTKSKYIIESDKPIFVEHTIASGTIIKMSVFNTVGMMNEALFIDYVDFEWCWRLKHYGGKLLCIPNVVINHNLGDDYKKIFGRKVCVRSDFRYYYMIRNGLQLALFYPYLTFSERFYLFKKTFLLTVAVFFLRNNSASLKTLCKGWKEGLCKKGFFEW